MFYVNVEGAVYKNQKWLVIQRSSKEEHAGGLLSLVGGTVENEGTSKDIIERTLKRELFEEVGILVNDKMTYVRSTSFSLENRNEVIDLVFLCENIEGEAFAKSPEEVEAVYWMTAKEIMNHPHSPIWLKESIQAAEETLKLVTM